MVFIHKYLFTRVTEISPLPENIIIEAEDGDEAWDVFGVEVIHPIENAYQVEEIKPK